MDGTPFAELSATRHVPAGLLDVLAQAALIGRPGLLDDVAVHVTRHGARRVFHRRCTHDGCDLVHNTDADYAEAGAAGAGHLYARRKDLAGCRSADPVVGITRTSSFATGRAYDGVPRRARVPRGARYLVMLKVPRSYPEGVLPAERTYHRAKTAGATMVATPADDAVFVLGHELRHVQQFREGLPLSEVDAEHAGRALLQAWVAAGRPGILRAPPRVESHSPA